MTWYKGGKENRQVMLTRYNTKTGIQKTIEFPHRHTGFQNKWWIGESHNTIAVAISPLDGTIHLLYDMLLTAEQDLLMVVLVKIILDILIQLKMQHQFLMKILR